MGWDVTYHPIAAEEIRTIYFKGLTDHTHRKHLITQFGIDEYYAQQLINRFEEANVFDENTPFNKGHAFYVAIISGYLRKHHYLRGAAFSFIANDEVMSQYISDWKNLVPEEYRDLNFDNCLTENYCGGVFLSNESLKKLRKDYDLNTQVREIMDVTFSHGRLEVFWMAVDEAIEKGLGLLEASEVVEPNPFDLNSTTSVTNLYNCRTDGVYLYEEAAMQQIG